MYCKKCRTEILKNADFCQNCGTPITKQKDTKKTYKIVVSVAAGAGMLILLGGAFFFFGRACSNDHDNSNYYDDYSSVSIDNGSAGSISPVTPPEKTTSAKTVSDETTVETSAETASETTGETSAPTESEKKSSDTELLNYLGTSFSAFTEMEGNMYDAGASSGIQYQNDYLVICGDIPSENTISFCEITGSCDYTIYGLSYGMDKEEAYDILMPYVLTMSTDEPDYKYCYMTDGTKVAVHAEGGKISSLSLWESTGNFSSSNYKEAYINAVENISSCSDVTTVSYTLYDMDNSGIPELIVISGTCEADAELVFYTYADGLVKRVSDVFSGFHTGFYRDTDTGQFCTQWGQMGTGGISWYTFDGKRVEREREVNDIKYDSNDGSVDSFDNYGNFAECFRGMLSYSDFDKEWTTWNYSEDGQNKEYMGKNYDLINSYSAD